MRLKAGFRKLAARMVGRPQQARFVKRPSVFIEGDRLLPEDIKPWKGSGTVPIRIAPTGLGVLQVPYRKRRVSTVHKRYCFGVITVLDDEYCFRIHFQTKERVSLSVNEIAWDFEDCSLRV